jgi:hypothetical protein
MHVDAAHGRRCFFNNTRIRYNTHWEVTTLAHHPCQASPEITAHHARMLLFNPCIAEFRRKKTFRGCWLNPQPSTLMDTRTPGGAKCCRPALLQTTTRYGVASLRSPLAAAGFMQHNRLLTAPSDAARRLAAQSRQLHVACGRCMECHSAFQALLLLLNEVCCCQRSKQARSPCRLLMQPHLCIMLGGHQVPLVPLKTALPIATLCTLSGRGMCPC